MSRTDSRFLMMARPAVAGVLLAFCAMPAWSAPPIPHPSDSLLVVEPLYADSTPVRQGFLYRRELLRPRLGLTLSGGGARGVAQIGVLKVVERHRIPMYVITGTSMGAIIGGLYASGYTAAELETLALTTDWDDVLSLSDASERRDLFLDQKSVDDRSFIALRFQGLEPVIPTAVSSGQRLTDFLNQKILQGLYHAHPTFDELKIPFRAVATDLVSGRSVILRDGSLAEALRASATVPILFQPVEKDSMRLLDGGLVRNIPVDVARESGADMVLAVNTTSGLRGADQMTVPWQTADQIMGIMMQLPNEEQLAGADIVLTPRLGEHLSSNFTGLDSLIALGERAADSSLTKIVGLYRARMDSLVDPAERLRAFTDCRVMHADPDLHPSSVHDIGFPPYAPILTMGEIRNAVNRLYDTGMYREVHAEIRKRQGHDITIVTVPNPPLTGVEFSGCAVMPDSNLRRLASGMLGNTINVHDASRFLEDVVRAYRAQGYSLARIDSMTFDESTGVLRIRMDEGVIADVQIEGGIRTQDAFVLREFVLRPGDVFEIGKAQQGITNISSTDLFEYVYLEVDYVTNRPLLRIRIRERPSQLLRLGVRADNERHLQGLVDIRDDNFRGTGMVLGLAVAGGVRNVDAVLDFQARRLFDTYMTLGAGVFYRQRDAYLYADGPPPAENRWVRENVGEYRDRRFGMRFAFGGLLERLGNATAEYSWQRVRVDNLRNAEDLVEEFDLAMIRLNTVVDTKDAYPFPTAGIAFTLSYEFALKTLGGSVGYNALRIQYESYTTWGNTITFHPRFTMGFADQTMPFAQQFHLGGRESFYGLREDDRLGRQVLVANIEFRYTLPVKLLFDTYIRARYDIGTISSVPEEITLNSLLHGVGVELAWATPVGPAAVGAGQAFYFAEARPQNTLQRGPVLWYFMIGYEL